MNTFEQSEGDSVYQCFSCGRKSRDGDRHVCAECGQKLWSVGSARHVAVTPAEIGRQVRAQRDRGGYTVGV